MTTIPHNAEAEKIVLGAAMLDPECIDTIADAISLADFYGQCNQVVWEQILRLHDGGEPAEMAAVVMSLQAGGQMDAAGGAAYVAGLPEAAVSTTNVKFYCETIRRAARCREVLTRIHTAEELARGMDPDGAADALLEEGERAGDGVVQGAQVLEHLVQTDIPRRMDLHASGRRPGLQMPWETLGSMLSPEPGDLVVIAGRPAMGKSAVVQMMSDYHSRNGIGVFEANLEMPRAQSFMRRLAPRAGVPFMDVRKGTLDRDQYARVSQAAFDMQREPYWIDDTPGQTVEAIRRKARRLKRANPHMGVLAVDYLTLCHPPARLQKGNRAEQVGHMAQAFKDAAKELDLVVYLLAQLNREVDKRADKHPVMGDLRESGGIEQAADTIVFVMRPGYYDESDTSGEVDFDIAKQRNGKTGRVSLLWTPDTTWFADKPIPEHAPPWRPRGQ